jgi:hypothetical protein
MKPTQKQIWTINIVGTVLLFAIMLVLNNHIEKKSSDNTFTTQTSIGTGLNKKATNPLIAKVPQNTEASLPIKMISVRKLSIIDAQLRMSNKTYTSAIKQITCSFYEYTHCNKFLLLYKIIESIKNKDVW